MKLLLNIAERQADEGRRPGVWAWGGGEAVGIIVYTLKGTLAVTDPEGGGVAIAPSP